jgi:chloride channel 7
MPVIIAMLNGMNLPAVVSMQSLLITACGLCFSIASGLTVGPEGPMIHVGAAIGRQCLKYAFPQNAFPGFNDNPAALRQFVAIGAGAGVAGAFKAPFAGVMFVVEELASSMMSVTLVVASLIANTVCFFTVFWLEKAQDSGPVKVEFQVEYGASMGCGYGLVDMLAIVPLAVFLGLWGALFNDINVKLGVCRKKWAGSKAKRLAELFLIVLATAAVVTIVPVGFECKSAKVQDLLHHSEIRRVHSGQQLKCVESDVYYKFISTMNYPSDEASPQVWKYRNNATDTLLGGLDVLKHYGCHKTNEEGEYEFYNPIASLFLQAGPEAAKVLFEHSLPKVLPLPELVVAFFFFSIFSCICAGACIPSGLVIPHILIGACAGRFWGLALNQLDNFDSTVADPGVYAIVGAVGMLAGSGRVPLFFAAVMVEITNDREYVPPLVLCTFIAMLVGNHFNHGYYHALIHMNGLPMLSDEPVAAQEKLSAADVMASPVVTLNAGTPLCSDTTVATLLDCDPADPQANHAAYPVVDESGRLIGLADAKDIAEVSGLGKTGLCIEDATDIHLASVRSSQPAAFAFTLYRRLCQRHVPVVDADNKPVGMITRHNLDGHKAEHLVTASGVAPIKCVRRHLHQLKPPKGSSVAPIESD